ncbi:hypothetical protein [Paenibacillus agricola]|uniref:hypothetical protein n=1 Tax=Paenibacillus agricola TaxID=2716264 RepID=UPI001A9DC6A5|nr:hypothetical protein [Paenibacillus agricola]
MYQIYDLSAIFIDLGILKCRTKARWYTTISGVEVGADKGYDRSPVHHGLEKLEIEGYIAPIDSDENHLKKSGFTYDKTNDTYTCKEGKTLRGFRKCPLGC